MFTAIDPLRPSDFDRRRQFPGDRRLGSLGVAASERELVTARRTAWLSILGWTILSLIAFHWRTLEDRDRTLQMAHVEAKTRLDAETTLRNWIAAHGGVYVAPDERTRPNPYLAHAQYPNVVTTEGKQLTLINTSYLTRLLHEFAPESFGAGGYISGPKPLNPGNAPQDWEGNAYAAFSTGATEHAAVIEENGQRIYALARVLKAKPECLKCHTDPALKEGDILGALSMRVDLTSYFESERRTMLVDATTQGIIWLAGFLSILAAFRINISRLRERHSTQQILIESQRLFQTIADYSSDWIFWRNPDGRFRYVSPACETISGYADEDFYADPELFLKIVHPDDREAFRLHVEDADRGGSPPPQELRILTRDGLTRYLSHTCSPIDNDMGIFVGVCGANHDITRLRENEQILVNQSRHAAMGEMISNIAHQWRQPISAVGLILQNLQYDYDAGHLEREGLHDYVARAREQVDRMSTTIDDFRSFFRPEHDPRIFDIRQPIHEAIRIVQDSFRANGIEINWPDDDAHKVFGYPNELAQVILNLLGNAKDVILDRHAPQGRVEIHTEATADRLVLKLRDNGGGIPLEVLPFIFDPYFTTKSNGTGIGLYMSATILGHMNGSISAANVESGAEFTLTLPLASEAEGSSP